jgi:hypothetical protein
MAEFDFAAEQLKILNAGTDRIPGIISACTKRALINGLDGEEPLEIGFQRFPTLNDALLELDFPENSLLSVDIDGPIVKTVKLAVHRIFQRLHIADEIEYLDPIVMDQLEGLAKTNPVVLPTNRETFWPGTKELKARFGSYGLNMYLAQDRQGGPLRNPSEFERLIRDTSCKVDPQNLTVIHFFDIKNFLTIIPDTLPFIFNEGKWVRDIVNGISQYSGKKVDTSRLRTQFIMIG